MPSSSGAYSVRLCLSIGTGTVTASPLAVAGSDRGEGGGWVAVRDEEAGLTGPTAAYLIEIIGRPVLIVSVDKIDYLNMCGGLSSRLTRGINIRSFGSDIGTQALSTHLGRSSHARCTPNWTA